MKGRKILALLTGISVLVAGSGCNDKKNSSNENNFVRGEEIEVNPTVTDRYTNQYDIEGQWGSNNWTGGNDYGIGDPFVMRWNGKYYMYPSTNDAYKGVRVFVSNDMINWTYAGYALADTVENSKGAYAPEVVYYDGYFYMCQSRGGKGHYIYRSQSPTEGFELVSTTPNMSETDINYGNLGMGIDGSFYVSDKGELFILHTVTPAGLQFNQITDVENINYNTISKQETLGTANLNHWIEGPGIFRRGDYSYLTYCGNHVVSKGYRIGYSYAKDLNDLTQFIQPTDNITIINTDDDHYGLGHSSNMNGPDLDSVYTAYHSYVSGGPCRRYNVDRYFASGSLLTANGVTHRPVAMPSKPTAEAQSGEELSTQNGIFTVGSSQEYFTAEYNLVPAFGQELHFGEGYGITFGENKIILSKKGKEVSVGTVNYTAGKLVTVRVENGNGVGYIYLNGMRIISYGGNAGAGLVGYTLNEGVSYTAFSNDVFGTSDFEAVKNFPTRFPATTYLKGENRGFSIRNAKIVQGGIRVGEKQDITVSEDGENAVKLGNGDWVKYAIDVESTQDYSISAKTLRATDATLKITVGDKVHTCLISANEGANVSLGKMNMVAGVTTMKVEVVSGEVELIWLDAQIHEEESSTELSTFKRLRGNMQFTEEGLRLTSAAQAGDDTVVVWGSRGLGDYEGEFTFLASIETLNFGFMLRSNDYSYHKDQPSNSWRGYYLEINSKLIAINRYDYSSKLISAAKATDILDGNLHTVKFACVGNSITVWLDGNLVLDAVDDYAFTYGKVGVFVGNGEVTVCDFKFKSLQ